MSEPSTIGSVCVKEEVKGTEWTCDCQTCSDTLDQAYIRSKEMKAIINKIKQQDDPPKEFEVTFAKRFKEILA